MSVALPPLVQAQPVNYQVTDNPRYNLPIHPLPCNKFDPTLSCPVEMAPIYQRLNEPCARSYEEFLTNPIQMHYWVEDPEITAQGKADERARQFLYWVISTSAVDEAPVLRSVWSISSTIALFGVVLIAVIFGIGYIISQKTNYNFNIRIWPTLIKLGFMLLYIAFSAAIVFFLIQISEVLMKFFYENLGGSDLFNIYFAPGPNTILGRTEESYKIFYGCRDLNIRVNEGIHAEMFMLKMTNVTYYVMGTMILLRKILLWFLLFVSPFLALLMPFVFVRNTGWIWIGVFFQWLFYGPLLTLFLGGMARIWKDGIPFNFDFSRVSRPEGYVYPTGINIVYGGPAQRIEGAFNRPIGADNNGNYVDTFSEYVITLIMLWAVTFFPWWLLRIFRDYCCEGILAMKNILLAMYDQMRGTPPAIPPGRPTSTQPSFKVDLKNPLKTEINIPSAVRLGNLGVIKTSASVDIAKSLNLHLPKLADIARMETNTQSRTQVNQNISYLSNPTKAQTPVERQQFMNVRTELFNRAIKSDTVAHTILASTSASRVEKTQMLKEVLKTIPQTVTIQQIVTKTTSQPIERVQSITNNFVKSITNNNSVVNNIAKNTNTSSEVVKNVMQSYAKHMDQPVSEVIQTIARETNTSESNVRNIIKQNSAVMRQSQIFNNTAQTQQITQEQTTSILNAIKNSTSESTVSNTAVTQNQLSTLERIFNVVKNNTNQTNINTSQNVTSSQSNTQQTNIEQKTIEQLTKSIYETAVNNAPVMNQVSQTTNVDQNTIKNIVQSFENNLNQTTSQMLQNISNATNLTSNQIQHVLQTMSQTINSNSAITQQIAHTSQVNEQTVQQISGNIPVILQEQSTAAPVAQDTVVKVISYASGSTEETAQKAVQGLMTAVLADPVVMNNIQVQTGLQPQQIQNVITTYTQNINQPHENLIQTINQTSGVSKENVQKTLTTITDTVLTSQTIVHDVAQSTGLKDTEVAAVMQNQMQIAAAPEKHIEQAITMPSSVSLEDYEDVKEMWTKHYEESDVPVSEKIKNREDWLVQDIAFITNTLNKLLSPDPKLREQGLEDLGYLLPVVLINSLKGEELLVYLKAKLEAAKATLKALRKEMHKEVPEEEEEELFVENTQKKEEDKHMEVDDEEQQDTQPQSIEDREKAVQEKLKAFENNEINTSSTDPKPLENLEESPALDGVKKRLLDEAEKEMPN